MADDYTTEDAGQSYLPRAAGVVVSGPGAEHVHLVFRQDTGWVTACPASAGGRDGSWGRQVRPALELIDCPVCTAEAGDLVAAVNRGVSRQQQYEAAARKVVVEFLQWAAAEYPLDEGGAVLAIYAGSTRLHPLRTEERAQAVDLWLAARRRYPGDG